MTEAQWLACRTSRKLMDFLRNRLGERKLRLIGCACCRSAWPELTLAEIRTAVEVAESIADGVATEAEKAEGFRQADYARNMTTGTVRGIPKRYKKRTVWCTAFAVYELVVSLDPNFAGHPSNVMHACVRDALDYLSETWQRPSAERLRQAHVIRDIVGNPFSQTRFAPDWRTTDVTLLAQRIYDTRDFGALPILADALQDAGCTHDALLAHLRDPKQTHWRGCWALDLALARL